MSAVFYNRDGDVLPVNNTYIGCSCFLICSGPSLNTLDLSKLNQPGIITCGVNNSVAKYRPNIHVSVDDPANFIMSAWRDPRINNFTMLGKRKKTLWNSNKWFMSKFTVKDCPNVTYYKDNEYFEPDKYLAQDTVNWGNHTNRCECGYFRKDKKKEKVCKECGKKQFGSRTVMLAAVKILYSLGFRKIFMIGADFKMEEGKQNYAFEQDRARGSVKNNNNTYQRLNERFDKLRPYLEASGCYVFNCYKDSGLRSFEYVHYDRAVNMCLNGLQWKGERTKGMYDRKANERRMEKEKQKK